MAGEVGRVESQLAGREMDPERGYVIYKVQEHRVCVCLAPRACRSTWTASS